MTSDAAGSAAPVARPEDLSQLFAPAAADRTPSNEDALLRGLISLAVPALADWCMVTMGTSEGELRETCAGGLDPDQDALLADLRHRARAADQSPGGPLEVMHTGVAELHGDRIPETPAALPAGERRLLDGIGVQSSMVVPLRLGEHVVGALTLLSTREGRVYDERAVQIVEELGSRCVSVIEDARRRPEATRSVALLDALFASAPVSMTFFDRELRYQRLNARAAESFGSDPARLLGRRPSEVLGQLGVDGEARLRQVLTTREPMIGLELSGQTPALAGQTRHWRSNYTPVIIGDEVVGVLAVGEDITERKLAEAERARALGQATFLSEVSTLLDSSLDYETTLQNLASVVVANVADWCAIDMLEPDGTLRHVAVAHPDPAKEKLAWELSERYPPRPDDPTGAAHVVRTGETEVYNDITDELLVEVSRDAELLEILRGLALRASIVAPLVARGQIIGALTLVADERRQRFTPEDVQLAEELARRAALSVQNALLFTERDEALARLDSLFENAPIGLGFWDREIRYLRVNEALAEMDGLPSEAHEGRTVAELLPGVSPEMTRILERVVREGATVRDTETELETPAAPGVKRRWTVGYYPVRDRSGEIIGAGAVCDEITELRRAQQAEAELRDALERALEAEHGIAETLQRALLPERLPTVPGLEVSARYQAAGEHNLVGGDFFDVFEGKPGDWFAVIGDVVGKGAEAAALTALARHTLRAGAIDGRGPAELLRFLNDAMRRSLDGGQFCTVALARLRRDGEGFAVTLALGGHPPAWLLRRRGRIEEVGKLGMLIGSFPDPELHEASTRLHPGDALLLYTDGLAGGDLAELSGVAGDPQAPVGDWPGSDLEGLLDALERYALTAAGGRLRDDVALLAVAVPEKPGD